MPADTRTVAAARHEHALLYAQIAEDHARIAAELKAAQAQSNSDLGEIASNV